MSKIAFVADCHVGNFKAHGGLVTAGLNVRGQMSTAAFREAVVKARDSGADTLFVAGDLFHSRRPEPAVIAAVLKALVEEAAELPVVIIPGNHDMLDATAELGNTACEPLYQAATIINDPSWVVTSIGNVLAVPFRGGMPMADYLDEVLNGYMVGTLMKDDSPAMLLTHVGVYDDQSPPWCKDATDAIHKDRLFALLEQAGIETAFVGNFHHMRAWSHVDKDDRLYRIVQCGTLCPHSHSDQGQFPRVGAMWMFDGEDLEPVEIAGPRFINMASETSGVDRCLVMAQPELKEKLGDDTPFEVLFSEPAPIDEDETQAVSGDIPALSDAVEAINAFLQDQKLPEGVSIEAVKTRVFELWNAAEA
jgi:hypothetical protein